jgi:hypothetical protein
MLEAGIAVAAAKFGLRNHPAVSPDELSPWGPGGPAGPGTETIVGAEQNWVTQQLRADGRIAAMLPHSIEPARWLARRKN